MCSISFFLEVNWCRGNCVSFFGLILCFVWFQLSCPRFRAVEVMFLLSQIISQADITFPRMRFFLFLHCLTLPLSISFLTFSFCWHLSSFPKLLSLQTLNFTSLSRLHFTQLPQVSIALFHCFGCCLIPEAAVFDRSAPREFLFSWKCL